MKWFDQMRIESRLLDTFLDYIFDHLIERT